MSAAPLSPALLDELEAREREATPGPWSWDERGGTAAFVLGPDGDELARVRMNLGLGSNPDRDARLIALARNALPDLIALARGATPTADGIDPGRLGRYDAAGKPLWHAPLPNPDFDAGVSGASMFTVCQFCDETWPCRTVTAATTPVPISAVWLRADPDGPIEVLVEIDGQWRVVVSQGERDRISHIVEALGIRFSALLATGAGEP